MAVLDTCTFLWLVDRPEELSERAKREIDRAAELYLSSISVTEIHRLIRLKELEINVESNSLDHWFRKALEHHRVTCHPITLEIAHEAELLPLIHKDPADRFILATAHFLQTPVISPDILFPQYPVSVIW